MWNRCRKLQALAEKLECGKMWGYTKFHCAEVKLQAQDLDATKGTVSAAKEAASLQDTKNAPPELYWLKRSRSYETRVTPTE